MWKDHPRIRSDSTKYGFFTASIGSISDLVDITMSIASNYRGRISYTEALDLEMHHFQTLRHMMYLESKSEEAQQAKTAEVIEDEIAERM